MRPLIFPLIIVCLGTGCISNEGLQFSRLSPGDPALAREAGTRARAGARSDVPVQRPVGPPFASAPMPNPPAAQPEPVSAEWEHVDAADLVSHRSSGLADVMSQLRQEGVVDGQAAPPKVFAANPNTSTVNPPQRTMPRAPSPLADAARQLPTPLAAHVSRQVAGTVVPTPQGSGPERLASTRQPTPHIDVGRGGTVDVTPSFENYDVTMIPVDASMSIDNLSTDYASIEIDLVSHANTAVADHVQRLPQPSAELRSIGAARFAVYDGPASESQPLGWDPFEEDYPTTTSPSLSRIAVPDLKAIPAQPIHANANLEKTDDVQPVAAGAIRFRDDGLPARTAPMAKFRSPAGNTARTAQVAFVEPSNGADKGGKERSAASNGQLGSGLTVGTRTPAGSGQGAAMIRFADSEQTIGPSATPTVGVAS